MTEPALIEISSAEELDPAELIRGIADRGAVHVRGLGADEAALDRAFGRCCGRSTCDPGKVVTGGMRGAGGQLGRGARFGARTVARALRRTVGDASGERARYAPFSGFGINPHTENCFLPDAAPEVVWFACLQPAADGGDSVLVDGAEMLARLDDATARWIRHAPVRYDTTLSESQWRAVWNEPDLAALEERLGRIPGAKVASERADRLLRVVYDAEQVGRSRLGGREAIRTNLLSRHPYDNIGRDHAERTADDEPIDRDLLLRLLDATRPTVQLRLDAGDLLVIDNTRVMHGRTPFTDTKRRVITRCGWWRDGLAPSPWPDSGARPVADDSGHGSG